jgi:hypothetical protein
MLQNPSRAAVRVASRIEPTGPELVRRMLLRAVLIAIIVLLGIAAAGLWWPPSSRFATGASVAARVPVRAGAPAPSPKEPANRERSVSVAESVPVSNASAPQLAVHLRAVREVWLRAVVDGRNFLARTVKADEDLTFTANREIVLRAGDAGALLIGVDGAGLRPLGRAGAVLTRRLHPAVTARSLRVSQPPDAAAEARPAAPLPHRDGPALRRPVHHAIEERQEPLPVLPPLAPGIGVWVSSSPAPAAPEPVTLLSDEESAVLRVHEQYFAALARGDRKELTLLTDAEFSATGAPATHETGIPFPISLSSAVVEVRGVGAVVSGTASQRISGPDGQGRAQPLLFSEVWIRRDGQWRLMNVRFVANGAAR